jgi:hypothetical protein
MNDDRLDQQIRAALAWQADRDASRAPSLATSARRVAERLGPQPASFGSVVTLRPASGRGFQLLLTVILLGLLAAAATIIVGTWKQAPTVPTGLSGPLDVARGTGHAAVGLPDGRVLVVGGWQGHRPVGSAELWDPVTETFTPTGTLEPARNHASATLLQDGRVLVAGGFAGNYEYRSNAVARADLWDPATGSFTETGSLVVARAGHSATLLPDGRVMVTGGGPTEVWDPATGEFRQLGPVVGEPAIQLPDGRSLVVGGTSAKVWEQGSTNASEAGLLLEARTDHSATLLGDGWVLVVGGRAHPGTGESGSITDEGFEIVADRESPSRLASAELWDPTTGLFTPAGSLARGRVGHTATLLPDGRVLILGGEGIVDVVGNRGYRDNPGAELWDPVTRTFSAAPSLVETRADHSAILLADGRVLVVGGKGPEDGGTFLRSVEIYDPNGGVVPTPTP